MDRIESREDSVINYAFVASEPSDWIDAKDSTGRILNDKYFDFFAGIGGFKLAAQMTRSSKYKLVHSGFCEIDPVARKVYERAHMNGRPIQNIDDITKIQTKRNKKGTPIEGFDIMFGGFPCQSFSNVGYRKGLEDERGQLFYNILDVLDMLDCSELLELSELSEFLEFFKLLELLELFEIVDMLELLIS